MLQAKKHTPRLHTSACSHTSHISCPNNKIVSGILNSLEEGTQYPFPYSFSYSLPAQIRSTIVTNYWREDSRTLLGASPICFNNCDAVARPVLGRTTDISIPYKKKRFTEKMSFCFLFFSVFPALRFLLVFKDMHTGTGAWVKMCAVPFSSKKKIRRERRVAK